MEIKIKEKIDSLEITKNCKQELRKNSIISFCIIILVYSVFIYNCTDPKKLDKLI